MKNSSATSVFNIKAGVKVILFTTLVGATFSLWADEPPKSLEPGLWEVVTRPEFPNTPIPPAPKTDRYCLSVSDMAAGLIPVRTAPACKVLGGTYKGQQLELNIECSDIPKASGKLDLADKTFTGRAELLVVPGQDGVGRVAFYYNYTGRWVSACPKTPEKTETPPFVQ